MGFVKVVKTKGYFRRYQTRFRRRREGKTDYQARKFLTYTPKNKYNTPKYRFAVRFTNRKVVCQVIYPSMQGDRVLAEAQSSELTRYGIQAGLTNYAASYATGLLCARRTLKALGMDSYYLGVSEPTGAAFDVYKDFEARATKGEEFPKRPFKAFLDVGLVRTTTGNRVFGAMKGACDGGVYIPHSTKRFPGTKGKRYNAEAHRERIYGEHVDKYMKLLKDEDPEKYEKQFSKLSQFLNGRTLGDLYKSAFAAIRQNPEREVKQRQHPPVHQRQGAEIKTHTATYLRPQRLTNQERKENLKQKIANAANN